MEDSSSSAQRQMQEFFLSLAHLARGGKTE